MVVLKCFIDKDDDDDDDRLAPVLFNSHSKPVECDSFYIYVRLNFFYFSDCFV